MGGEDRDADTKSAGARSRNLPFFIANLQIVAPTVESSFDVPRDGLGRALRAATGGGLWSVSPCVTAILPTNPAVLFGEASS